MTTRLKDWYAVDEIEAEIERLGNLLMRLNMRYLNRELQLNQRYASDPDLMRRLETDKLLSNFSGAARVVATLLTGLGVALNARKAR